MSLRSIVVLAAVLLAAVSIQGQTTSPLIGTWKLNVEKSKYNPGPGPKSQTIRWEAAEGGMLKFSTDTVNARGQTNHSEGMETLDGKEHPVKGPTPNMVRAIKRINDRTFEDFDKVDGKIRTSRRLSISPDGKTLTVTTKGTNAEGQATNNVVVMERQ